jgi:GMP synthase-like glutamine amidotransferase
MIVGLLICDHARKELNHPDGSYPEMFRRILPGFEFVDYYVCDGKFPAGPFECDGWIISGSRLSVYDDVHWILQLKKFTREVAESGNPCIGVCFGHQMIGAALGGVVTKVETGWSLGVHQFEILGQEPWMKPALPTASLLMSCQDQVVKLPPHTKLIAKASNIPNGMFLVGKNMLGIQGHPEFSVDFEHKLMLANAHLLTPELLNTGIASLEEPVHSGVVAGWMSLFLKNK